MDININSITGIPYFNNININMNVVLIATIVIICYYLLFSSLGNSELQPVGTAESNMIIPIELFLWSVFVLLLLLNGMSYLFNVDLTTTIKDVLSKSPQINVTMNNEPTAPPEKKKEVFHIPGNIYGYKKAKKMCLSHNAKLANYQEISDAYDKGADWCSYGWSEGQMALFPTQQKKWDNLQNIQGHEHDCGRPGINGGYIKNPDVAFGVNCYGYKPDMKKIDKKYMSNNKYPESKKEKILKDAVKKIHSNVVVASFNENSWLSP